MSANYGKALLVAACLIAPSAFVNRINSVMFTVGFLGLAVGYGVLLLVVIERFPLQWELSWAGRTFAKIGTWSYNIYLWHFFIPDLNLFWFSDVNHLLVRHVHMPVFLLLSQVVWFGVVAILTGALATMLIEMPFLALRSKLIH